MSQLAVPSASAIGCCTKFNNDCLQDDITMVGRVVWSRPGPARPGVPKFQVFGMHVLDLQPI